MARLVYTFASNTALSQSVNTIRSVESTPSRTQITNDVARTLQTLGGQSGLRRSSCRVLIASTAMSDACGLVRLLKPAPRTNHTHLPPELWLEIFRYATYVPRIRGFSPGDPFEPERPSNFAWGVNTPVSSFATKRCLVLVCRAWRALATELLYEHVVVNSKRRATLLLRTLHESDLEAQRRGAQIVGCERPKGHAQFIRHVEIRDCARTSRTEAFWMAVAAILSMLPDLRVLSGIWERPLSQNLVEIFSRYLGSTIHRLYWEEAPVGGASVLTESLLRKFHSLRVLDIRRLKLKTPQEFLEKAAAHISLPFVIDLLLPTCPTLLEFAAKLELPRLHRLVIDTTNVGDHPSSVVLSALNGMLAVHGNKITILELLPITSASYKPCLINFTTFLQPDVCPILDTLVFDCREEVLCAAAPHSACSWPKSTSSPARPSLPASPTPSSGTPMLSHPHPTLRRIGIREMVMRHLYPNRPNHAQQHLHAFLTHRALFPALETVRTLGFLVDASTDPFARDIFIWWTEKYEEQGIDFQDGEGVVWLYTDPVEGQEVQEVAEEQLVPGNFAKLVHKSDAKELTAAKC
ncbi:uncharacterized protein LAESUDRAFT_747489 [Laetiporus sulphureus 93-53]|uniref:Uncharacterized protein n=1 Tax=Laetiporus sulphureus 93-53 TaxID=1314785 RepID=A0A165GVU5_9APHY|nr:uncharacterized protein LAESUDRAFT_747489 [Laetiporus sulphureus 93-53]KZT10892.1 hypothetical protein LAESUDRAFT_747489 [Laetiporus sulphureus 93-53]